MLQGFEGDEGSWVKGLKEWMKFYIKNNMNKIYTSKIKTFLKIHDIFYGYLHINF